MSAVLACPTSKESAGLSGEQLGCAIRKTLSQFLLPIMRSQGFEMKGTPAFRK